MNELTPGNVDGLLEAVGKGERGAFDALLQAVYRDLRAVAGAQMRHERSSHTLTPTALANEAYLRLLQQSATEWKSKSHLMAVAAQVMRRILVDHARARSAAKRGGPAGGARVAVAELTDTSGVGVVDLHDALERFATIEPRAARVLELSVFGWMAQRDIAEAVGVSTETVKRDLAGAREWLRKELSHESTAGASSPGGHRGPG